jgi:hypothetical protein
MGPDLTRYRDFWGRGMKGESMSEGIVRGVERTHSYHGVLPALQQLAQRMSLIEALLAIVTIKICVEKVPLSSVVRAIALDRCKGV